MSTNPSVILRNNASASSGFDDQRIIKNKSNLDSSLGENNDLIANE